MLTSLVSVVLPVRNAERWIGDCLQSLSAQSYRSFETVLIDDGCTDKTVEIATSWGLTDLRVVQGNQEGLAAALSLGVTAARGEFIIRQDADDVSHPQRIERQVEYLQAHPLCVALGSAARVVAEDGRVLGRISPPESDRAIRLRMTTRSPFIHPSVAMRTSAVVGAGNYRSPGAEPYAEDYDLWLRLAGQGMLANLPDELITYRMTASGLSRARWRSIATSAQSIAADGMESWLGRQLSPQERELVGMFHGRSRRISPSEAVLLVRLLAEARVKAGPHRLPHALPAGDLLRPVMWAVVGPREGAW